MDLRKERDYVLSALMFYTRIPCPSWGDYTDESLNKSRKYFPLMGWVVGGSDIIVYLLAHVVLPASAALLLSMAATIYATGAFHEDGFADTCDAFGGGWTKEQILIIMKDSRIGTYGTVGVAMLLAIKFAALWELQKVSEILLLITVFNGHPLSRFIASTVVQSEDYVQDIDQSKIKPIATRRLSGKEMAFSCLFVILPLCFFAPMWFFVLAAVPAYLSRMYLAGYFRHRIGGYTGDCLGAIQQVCEVVFYLSVLSLCSFI